MALNIQETLLNNSSTAMSNLFAVTFTPENPVSDRDYTSFTYRLTGNVEFPSLTRTTVEMPFKDTSFKQVLPGLSQERSFSLQFRIDSNYELYKMLLNNIYEHTGLMKSSDFTNQTVDTFSIEVKLLGDLKNSDSLSNFLDNIYPDTSSSGRVESDSKSFVFRGCKLTDIQKITLGYESSNANTVTVGFIYNTLDIADFI